MELLKLDVSQLESPAIRIRDVNWDDDTVKKVYRSICLQGVFNPIIVRPLKDHDGNLVKNKFEIIEGNHRKSLSSKAVEEGFEIARTIPAFVVNATDEEAQILQFCSNEMRIKQKPVEVKRHLEKFAGAHPELTHEEIGQLMGGLSSAQVSQYLRLGRLTNDCLKWAEENEVKATKLIHWARLPETLQDSVMTPDEAGDVPVMDLPTGEFIDYVDAVLEEYKKTGKADKKPVVATLLPKKEIIEREQAYKHNIQSTTLDDEQNELLQKIEGTAIETIFRHREIQEVMQIDPASLQRKEEEKANRSKARKAVTKVKELSTNDLKAELERRANEVETEEEVEALN